MALGAICFNTQPPEGGWTNKAAWMTSLPLFQHTAARRRLDSKMGGSDGNGKFQHTAARRRLAGWTSTANISKPFQHTAARRRLAHDVDDLQCVFRVSTHSRPKAAGRYAAAKVQTPSVSTHSRPKAAGRLASLHACTPACFNTQPPEGGWPFLPTYHKRVSCFNTQPPEGGWYSGTAYLCSPNYVSTHSRPKAAGKHCFILHKRFEVSTHSRPKAAGDRPDNPCCTLCSFNTQPPEGGWGSRGLRFGS